MFNNPSLFFKRFRDSIPKAVGERRVIEKQRRLAFIYVCLTMFFADVALWFLGTDTFGAPVYEIIHPVHFLLTLSLFVSYLRRKLSVTAGVSILSVANQLSILFEMCMCLTDDTPRGIYLIMGYMVMAGLNMSLVLMAYIRVLPFVLGGLTMTAYGVCCWESGEGALIGMLPILGACFFVIALLGHRLSCNVYRLEHEKAVLKEDERKILDLLELDKSQLMAYISLAREKGLSTEQTETMLDLIGEKARENIRGNVSYYYRQREVDYANLRSFLPELTPSEIEICDLILKEKKLKEILHILGKSEGNITSQRANIRRKLGLDRRANLYDELRKRTRTE